MKTHRIGTQKTGKKTRAEAFKNGVVQFSDLEMRYGVENTCVIVQTLEQFEGISEARVKNLSYAERLQNVLFAMGEGTRYRTMH